MSEKLVFEMDNAELSEAIEHTHGLLRRTARDEPQYQSLNAHMVKLLDARASRAALFSVKDPTHD